MFDPSGQSRTAKVPQGDLASEHDGQRARASDLPAGERQHAVRVEGEVGGETSLGLRRSRGHVDC